MVRVMICLEGRGHDAGIAGAAAQMAADDVADLGLAGRRRTGEQGRQRHQQTRRAEAALQRVMLAERDLQRRQRAVGPRQAFDRIDPAAVGLHRQAQAGARGHAVEPHRAGAAHAVLAPDMGAGFAQLVAQEVA
jgi:hypothetical protein